MLHGTHNCACGADCGGGAGQLIKNISRWGWLLLGLRLTGVHKNIVETAASRPTIFS